MVPHGYIPVLCGYNPVQCGYISVLCGYILVPCDYVLMCITIINRKPSGKLFASSGLKKVYLINFPKPNKEYKCQCGYKEDMAHIYYCDLLSIGNYSKISMFYWNKL